MITVHGLNYDPDTNSFIMVVLLPEGGTQNFPVDSWRAHQLLASAPHTSQRGSDGINHVFKQHQP